MRRLPCLALTSAVLLGGCGLVFELAPPDPQARDAGTRDASMLDAGDEPDAGALDAGQSDAGQPIVDAGGWDAGTRDAGPPDAGIDAGPIDAGIDAGPIDAGIDAGPPDAGIDAGPADAGSDAGPPDAGIDAGPRDAGIDAGPPDAGIDSGPADAGMDSGPRDAGIDAGPIDAGIDAGPRDAGSDAGPRDAGSDAGPTDAGIDAGPSCASSVDCPTGSYCALPTLICYGRGTCAPIPGGCAGLVAPVCGCDFRLYSNSCEAARTGVNVMQSGACPAGDEWCALAPPVREPATCISCYDNADCSSSGSRWICVGSSCAGSRPGVCAPPPTLGACYDARSCGFGRQCHGAVVSVCPPVLGTCGPATS